MSASASQRRRVLRTGVSVALAAVVVASLFTDAVQRVLVQRGVPVPGWCTLSTPHGREAHTQAEMSALAQTIVTTGSGARALQRGAFSTPASVTCVVTQPDELREETPSPETGLTPRALSLKQRVAESFGRIPSGGYRPEGITSGRIPGSAHYDGRAIDYFFRPHDDPDKKKQGWTLAHWLVAHAGELHIYAVIYDDRIWTSARSGQGWREYVHPSGDITNPVLRHLDHVHVDVRRGG